MAAVHLLLCTFATYFQGISTLLLLLSMVARVDAQDQRNEVRALLSVKAANTQILVGIFDGVVTEIYKSPIGYWSTWKDTDDNACAWVGVTCTSNFTVEKLELSGWGLTQWPSVDILSTLTDLHYLDLSSNNLGNGGPISDKILNLPGLTLLDLSQNNFSSFITLNISASRSLRHLSLQQNQLAGPIPSGLRDCVNLEVLLLADNQFSGEIPVELGELRSLLTLDLSRNKLGGSVPSLSNLTNLVEFNLDNNFLSAFSGELPGSQTLEYLSLSSNRLEGLIPSSIANLVSLVYLDMSSNNLSGDIPHNLSANLDSIFLEENQLTGPILVAELKKLKFLILAHNLLSGSFSPGEINSLTNVDLSDNLFSGEVPTNHLTNVVNLILDRNMFTGFTQKFPVIESLELLSLSNNRMSGEIPNEITSLVHLSYLNLSQNVLEGSIPSGFSKQMKKGFSLDLSFNNLSGSIPSDLFQPVERGANIALSLSNNNLSGNIPFDGAQEYSYGQLDLSKNYLSGPVPLFGNNTNTTISSMSLHDNLLSGDLVDFLANNPGLVSSTELRLDNNFFSGDLSRMPSLYINFSSAQVMDISNNNLQMTTLEGAPNPLRAVFDAFNFGAIVEFRIGGNNFSGISLPPDFSSMSFLRELDLGNNRLTGEIANATFSSTSFPALRILKLANNDLTGLVPQSIVLLPFLATLDLTNNALSGPLPIIQPNSRLYNSSFYAGNAELCGAPLLPCIQQASRTGTQWWVVMIIVGGSITAIVGSCLITTWRWRVYQKRHQQDEDLIKMLMERESASLMTLHELKKATNNFAPSTQIGEGGFGTVYIGKLNDGTLVAIKRSKRTGVEKEKGQFLNEVRILSQVRHRHLVKLLGCCLENKIALLVFEFISNGTLQQHLQRKLGKPFLSWKQRLQIAMQTADALNYLHSAASYPIFHRDVKSANILLNEDLHAKVADFGISKLVPIEATHVSTLALQGTIGYMDPEYYASCKLTDRSDVYSFGVVLLELISAKPAIDFQRDGDDTSLVNFAKRYIQSGDLQQFVDPSMTETYMDTSGHGKESMLSLGRLAMKCLAMRSKSRPSMNKVLKDLQNLWLELAGTSDCLAAIVENDTEDPHFDHHVLRSHSLPNKGFRFTSYNDSSNIQMSEFVRLTT